MATATEPLVRDGSTSAASGSSPPATERSTCSIRPPRRWWAGCPRELLRMRPAPWRPPARRFPPGRPRAPTNGGAARRRGGPARRARGRARGADRHRARDAGQARPDHPGGPAHRHLQLHGPARGGGAVGGDDRQLAGGARARGRGGGHHAVELPAAPDRAKVAPALAAGCTVVLKPSEVAPLNAFVLAEIIGGRRRARGRVQPRHGHRPGGRRGDRRPHPGIDMVSFTGSTRAGRRVSRARRRSTVKRVALELGGKSPNVILDDADLAARRHRRGGQVPS